MAGILVQPRLLVRLEAAVGFALGYGLKYPAGPRETHLQRL